MGVEQKNQEVVRAYVEAMNAGDFDKLEGLFAKDADIHGVLGRGSLAIAMPIWRALHSSLAMHLEIEALATDGDNVVARFRETGRSVGEFRGQPATGNAYEVMAMEWFVIRDGYIVDRWGVRDSGMQARQIGWQA